MASQPNEEEDANEELLRYAIAPSLGDGTATVPAEYQEDIPALRDIRKAWHSMDISRTRDSHFESSSGQDLATWWGA